MYKYLILEKYDMNMLKEDDVSPDNRPLYCSETCYCTNKMLHNYHCEPYDYKAILNFSYEREKFYDLNDICPLNKA